MNNPLSDIYSNKVLLSEKKEGVAAEKSKMKIVPGNKVDEIEPLAKGRGAEKDAKKGYLKKVKNDPRFFSTKGEKGKSIEENMNTTNKYEGAFEKLFKSTLINEEDEMSDVGAEHEVEDHADEMPTSNEEMGDELGEHEDEADDLVSDIKAVIDSLHSILDKLTEHEQEEGHDMEAEEEGEEEPFEESLATDEAEEEGHALIDTKKLEKGLTGPKGKFNTGGVKTATGKAVNGTIRIKPDTTALPGIDKGLQNTKKLDVKTSKVKIGDFFNQ
jgi:hypothetical protein